MEVQNYVHGHGQANISLLLGREEAQVVQCRWDIAVLASTLRNQMHMMLAPVTKMTKFKSVQ